MVSISNSEEIQNKKDSQNLTKNSKDNFFSSFLSSIGIKKQVKLRFLEQKLSKALKGALTLQPLSHIILL